jgi:hypothetical protein
MDNLVYFYPFWYIVSGKIWQLVGGQLSGGATEVQTEMNPSDHFKRAFDQNS